MLIYNSVDITVCRKSSASGSSARADKQLVIPLITTSTVTGPIPPAMGIIGLTIRSSTEAWASSQRLTEFLERLKNAEANREGAHVSFCYFNPPILLAHS
jgi:hypothetical protein